MDIINPTTESSEVKVMVYTELHIFWGQLGEDENRMPELLLTGSYIPDNVCLIDSKHINPKHMGSQKPHTSEKMYIPTAKILGYHLRGNEKDNPVPEDNRIKKQITVLLGDFRISASIWTGPTIAFHKHLEMNKSQFMDVFDVSISIPNSPQSKPIKANRMAIRKDSVVFLTE